MPSTSAEMSRSRMAMKARPMRVRNRLAAPSSMSTVTGTMSQYRRNDMSRSMSSRRAGGNAMDQLRACMKVYTDIVMQPFGMCLIRVGDEEVPEPSRTELRRMKSEIDLAFRCPELDRALVPARGRIHARADHPAVHGHPDGGRAAAQAGATRARGRGKCLNVFGCNALLVSVGSYENRSFNGPRAWPGRPGWGSRAGRRHGNSPPVPAGCAAWPAWRRCARSGWRCA